MARGMRVTDTYIRCTCNGIGMSTDCETVFKYQPVIGCGYIEISGPEDWGDNVIPIEYDRFKTKIEVLKDLKYSVGFIANLLGATEEAVRKIVGKDYEPKDFTAVRAGYFSLLDEYEKLIVADNRLRDEINDLKRRYEMLQAKHNAISRVNDRCEEENKRLREKNDILTKQLSDLQDAYHKLYKSRDEHVKHIDMLTAENQKLSKAYDLLRNHNKTLTELIDDSASLRAQRNMAIKLLFCPPYSFAEIADALHIPTSLVKEIVEEGK